MFENLCLLFQDIPTVQINRHGSLHSWIHEASNEKNWCQLLDRLLHTATPGPERSADWGPLPFWQARRATNGPPPNGDTSDSNDETTADDKEEQPRTPPHPQTLQQFDATETHYDPKQWLNDPAFCSMVGRSMSHSLKILGLGLGASETEIKVHYRQLARKYHPDKNDCATTGLTMEEATGFLYCSTM